MSESTLKKRATTDSFDQYDSPILAEENSRHGSEAEGQLQDSNRSTKDKARIVCIIRFIPFLISLSYGFLVALHHKILNDWPLVANVKADSNMISRYRYLPNFLPPMHPERLRQYFCIGGATRSAKQRIRRLF